MSAPDLTNQLRAQFAGDHFAARSEDDFEAVLVALESTSAHGREAELQKKLEYSAQRTAELKQEHEKVAKGEAEALYALITEAWKKVPEPLAPLVDGVPFIIKGKLHGLTAPSGSGKTFITDWWSLLAAQAGIPVLRLDRDGNDLSLTKSRFEALGYSGVTLDQLLLQYGDWVGSNIPQPDDPKIIALVKLLAEKFGAPPLVVIDALIGFLDGKSDNDSETIRAFGNRCRKLTALGATVIAIHHASEKMAGSFYRGSTDYKAVHDICLYISNANPGKSILLKYVTVECFKWRGGEIPKVTYEFVNGKGFETGPQIENKSKNHLLGTIVARIFRERADQDGWVAKKAIVDDAEAEGISDATVERYLGIEVSEQRLLRRKDGKAAAFKLVQFPF